jgi:predicted amidohydrolase
MLPRSLASFFLSALSMTAFASNVVPVVESRGPVDVAPSAQQVKVAVIQWNAGATPLGVSQAEADRVLQRNRATLTQKIREAASHGATFVVSPEFAVPNYPDIPNIPDAENNYRNAADIGPYAEARNGATSTHFGALARELGIYLHVGYAEYDQAQNRYYNSVLALDPQGNVVANYRKVNLFQMETRFATAGDAVLTYESPIGRVGLLICADVYCGPVLEAYRRAEVDVLVLSTSWAQENTGMAAFTRAARSSGVHLLAANQTYYPDSGVINPDGSTQSHIRQSTGIAYGVLPRHAFDGNPRSCAHALAAQVAR